LKYHTFAPTYETQWSNDNTINVLTAYLCYASVYAFHTLAVVFEDLGWEELQQLWIPELKLTFGAACSSLRKSWEELRLHKNRGDEERVLHYAQVINDIQSALGIEMTEFDL
jgi:hypothetical protein